MKIKIFILMQFIYLILGSQEAAVPVLRASARTGCGMLPCQDPNLDSGWDWTTGEGCTMYYSLNGSDPTRLNKVRLPFFTPGDPLNQPGTRKDMYREDGWVLAYRDFGTPSDAPPLPFFVLYNRYRSILRCMFYNGPSATHTIYQGALKFRKGAKVAPGAGNPDATALLTFAAPPELSFLTAYDGSQGLVQLSAMDVYRGWATFDFVTSGYDPVLTGGKDDPALTLRITPVDESRIRLAGDGGLTLEQALQERTPTGAGIAGLQESFDAIGSGYTTYRHASDALTSLQTWAATRQGDGSWIGKAASAAALAAAGSGPVVPLVIGLAGAVLSFIGGSGGGDLPVAMNFVGKTQFDFRGAIEVKDATTWCTNLYLKEGPQMADGYRPVRAVPWGVVNLEKPPHLDIRTTATGLWAADPYAPWRAQWVGIDKESLLLAGAASPMVQVNPECGLRLVTEKLLLTYGTAREPLAVAFQGNPPSGSHPFPVPGSFLDWEKEYVPPSGMTYVFTFQVLDPGVINAAREIVYSKTVALTSEETVIWAGALPEADRD